MKLFKTIKRLLTRQPRTKRKYIIGHVTAVDNVPVDLIEAVNQTYEEEERSS